MWTSGRTKYSIQQYLRRAVYGYQQKQSLNISVTACLVLLSGLLLCSPLRAEKWVLLGPEGGDARSLAYDAQNPDRIFLGTSSGNMFISENQGQSWSLFAHLGGDDYVLDHIVVDPKNPARMFVAAWSVKEHTSGDVFRSSDGGKTWAILPALHGKSVRAFAMAGSDSNFLAAGTLDGIFRSDNAGGDWELMSPPDNTEIKNIESIAIDPKDSNVLYAGTWHLAWKTINGGASWQHINKGMINDSDVFSIFVDPQRSFTVYASACSGIYKSDNAGEMFHKMQGIPFAARRTRILRQDPTNSNVVYAGTTNGLWKTSDAGQNWKQMTSSDLVVNDIFIDPRSSRRLLLATDRSGVMMSNDGGVSFFPSNHGYTHRYVTAILPDMNDPGRVFAAVANDGKWGGVFSLDQGGVWQQTSVGLDGRDVFALAQAFNGELVAGTNRGIFILDEANNSWRLLTHTKTGTTNRTLNRRMNHGYPEPRSAIPSLMDARINDLDLSSHRWLVASSAGLFKSTDEGRSWEGGPVLGRSDLIAVKAAGRLVVAATSTEIVVSTDEGTTWKTANLSSKVSSIRDLKIIAGVGILVASKEGAFFSADDAKTWKHMLHGLPEKDLSSVTMDDVSKRLLATTLSSGVIFESHDGGQSWSAGPNVGYPLRQVKVVHGHLLGTTSFDGVIAQR